jgi:hypothetical protein
VIDEDPDVAQVDVAGERPHAAPEPASIAREIVEHGPLHQYGGRDAVSAMCRSSIPRAR